MQPKNYVWIIVLICLAIFFPHLQVVELNIMEARNFTTAREMLEYGNWIHTTMNLEPRYEKPPLPTWLTALSASFFGTSDLYGLRLPAAISALAMALCFYFLSIKILENKKQSLYATLIMVTSFYVVFAGRNGQWDIFAHTFTIFAIYHFFDAFERKGPVWKSWLLAGFFLGLSFMSKGPVSLFALFLPFLIAYGMVYRYRGFKKKVSPLLLSLLVFAVVGLTWGIYIYLTDSSSAEYIADKETKAWANRSVKPFYHYWSFFVQSGIWTVFAFIGLLYPYMINKVKNKKAYRFSLAWTLSMVVLLSMVPEKKERYLLPVLLPLAMNTSFYIRYLAEKGKALKLWDKVLANFAFGLIAVIALALPFALYVFFEGDFGAYFIYYLLSSLAFLALGGLMLFSVVKGKYQRAFYGIVLFLSSITLLSMPMAHLLYNNDAHHSLSTLREIDAVEDLPLYSTDWEVLPSPECFFALGEPLKRVKSADELPQKGKFGLLVRFPIPQEVQNEFEVEFISRFDENLIKQSLNRNNDRKTMELYLLEKKQ